MTRTVFVDFADGKQTSFEARWEDLPKTKMVTSKPDSMENTTVWLRSISSKGDFYYEEVKPPDDQQGKEF